MSIILVSLELIKPNPWQTRQGEPALEYIKELALDIAANGLLQTPVARNTGSTIQLAFGHNRLAAYKWLNDVKEHSNLEGDYSEMPLDIRVLTDEQMAQFAWSENEKRRDVTPIERALAIQKRMADFGWTQAQAAEQLGVSRPVVSNTLRLLKLPENITGALADGRISERVALALAGYFDLPEAIKKGASNSWYKPSDMVREALEGKLTSDGVREKINEWCRYYGKDMSKALFGLDEPFMIPDVQAPFCKDCEQRYKERNICLVPDCYRLKEREHMLSYLRAASAVCNIPPLEKSDDRNGYRDQITSFRSENERQTIVAGQCPNLRLNYGGMETDHVPGHPHAEIVCSKKEQFCTCLAGLRATQATTTYHYDYEKRESVKLVDPPRVTLETEQPSAQDLKEAARQARAEKRHLEQEKLAILEQASERIAVGLTHNNLATWKWLAGKVNYQLHDAVKPMDNTFDVRVAIARQVNAGATYPDHLEKCRRIFNEILRECGLEEIEGIEAASGGNGAKNNGKTLVEIFEEEQV